MNEIALRLASRIFDQRLIVNMYRSAFIEAMIEPYLEPRGWRYTGAAWCGWDFEHREGHRLEVKQSAAQQLWSSARKLETRGTFDIAARTGYYSEGAETHEKMPGRCAQTYVFAWNGFQSDAADHRDAAQWEFYVVPASSLPEGQRTISLSKVKKLARAVPIAELGDEIDRIVS
jgi:hypothetical protein